MLRVRSIALKYLPLLVVVWATVAMVGGALYLARHAGPPEGGHAAKAGLGLCAITVAILAGKAVRRATVPPPGPMFSTTPTHRLSDRPVPVSFSGPPSTGPPIFRLLRISRT